MCRAKDALKESPLSTPTSILKLLSGLQITTTARKIQSCPKYPFIQISVAHRGQIVKTLGDGSFSNQSEENVLVPNLLKHENLILLLRLLCHI